MGTYLPSDITHSEALWHISTLLFSLGMADFQLLRDGT